MDSPTASQQPADLDSQSVAGEEDPGASIDVAVARPAMHPGDEAPAGTPGTGEDICRSCGGSGQLNGSTCPDCEGMGKITVGIGGA